MLEVKFDSTLLPLLLLLELFFPLPRDLRDVIVSLLSEVGIDEADVVRLRPSEVANALIDEPIVAKET